MAVWSKIIPMTDKERLATLLADFGIEFTEDGTMLSVEAGTGPKNKGYTGFGADFEFLPDGTFKVVSIWE